MWRGTEAEEPASGWQWIGFFRSVARRYQRSLKPATTALNHDSLKCIANIFELYFTNTVFPVDVNKVWVNSSCWSCFPVKESALILLILFYFQLSITGYISSFHSLLSPSITSTFVGEKRSMHQAQTALASGFFMHPSLREQRLSNTSETSSRRCTEATSAVKTPCHSWISRQLVWFFLPAVFMFGRAHLPPGWTGFLQI